MKRRRPKVFLNLDGGKIKEGDADQEKEIGLGKEGVSDELRDPAVEKEVRLEGEKDFYRDVGGGENRGDDQRDDQERGNDRRYINRLAFDPGDGAVVVVRRR